jgi:ribokinase
MKPKIVVLGSSNTDMVVKLSRLPKPGETVIGGTFSMGSGGKGANQAVAAARAGGDIAFISKVGPDLFGKQALDSLRRDGLNVDFVGTDTNSPSGVALIFVDERGENCIGVASGANAEIRPADIAKAADLISSADVLLAQLEISLVAVEAALRIAARAGVRVVLNPAPAQSLKPELCTLVSVLTPNETEAEILSGIRISDDQSVAVAAGVILSKGVAAAVITLGARGAYVTDASWSGFIPPFEVSAVDTTAAGDVFNGALAVFLGEGVSLQEAVRMANAAAALSVTKLGAQPSAPNRRKIDALLQSIPGEAPLSAR